MHLESQSRSVNDWPYNEPPTVPSVRVGVDCMHHPMLYVVWENKCLKFLTLSVTLYSVCTHV